jgi:SAM-dependent MidA family methyltransferase
MPMTTCAVRVGDEIALAGGWIGFDRFMELALYTPGLGYYANDLRKFGHLPASGSDFVTAPEMTPLFGQTVAAQVAQALAVTQTDEVWEFGAGSGALAAQLLETLASQGVVLQRYTIVELSATLRERQRERLQPWAHQVRWVSALPDALQGVVLGNELLDAMPVKLLARVQGRWHERGVACGPEGGFVWQDRPTELRAPQDIPGAHDYLTEIHPQGEAFVRTVVEKLMASARGGAAFFIDYGFPQAEYYHPQRHMGTVMCHRAHQSDDNPLADVGLKDITAHVNFTALALAAQQAGDEWAASHPSSNERSTGTLGYCTQARFLMNCGLLTRMESAALPERAMALKLMAEHEMGELFKVWGLYVGQPWDALGFAQGDRTHTL